MNRFGMKIKPLCFSTMVLILAGCLGEPPSLAIQAPNSPSPLAAPAQDLRFAESPPSLPKTRIGEPSPQTAEGLPTPEPALETIRTVTSEPVKITGRAFVIDGDTLVVDRAHIRLMAIDAPEKGQTCAKPGQPKWACGAIATKVLRGKIGNRQVECIGEQWDSYGRLLAHCSLELLDLNRWMVASGWATAYRYFSQEYAPEEDLARSNQLGIWSSQFISPYEWRKSHP